MTDSDDSQLCALFEQARQPLPGDDFSAGVARELERLERSARLLGVVQFAALLGLLLPLSLLVEEHLRAWFQVGAAEAMSAQGPWWLAGCIMVLSCLLAPRAARSA